MRLFVRAGTALAAVCALVGCAPHQAGDGAEPGGSSPGAGTVGTNAGAGSVQLRNVHLVATEAGYPPGSGARAELFLINEGPRPDELVGVRSPQADRIELRWDRGCDGKAEAVPSIPITAQGTVPLAPGQPASATPYHLEVAGLRQWARPGTTFPITFSFAAAGEVTVDAKVQATRDGDAPPTTCAAPAGPPAATPPPAAPGDQQRREFTTTGTVRTGPSPDCRLLDDGRGRSYVLIGGDPARLRPGAELAVRGTPAPEVRTTCGYGPALHVLDSLPR